MRNAVVGILALHVFLVTNDMLDSEKKVFCLSINKDYHQALSVPIF